MPRKRLLPDDEPRLLIRTLAARFPDGAALTPHAHSWGQLIYAVSGVMSVWTEHGLWVAPPHWAVWSPAGIAHYMRFTGAASLRTLYFRPDRGSASSKRSLVISVSPLLRELIFRAVEIGMLDEREPLYAAMAGLITHELCQQPAQSLDPPLPKSPDLRRAAEQISQAPADHSSHATLAQRFGTGIRTLERGFVIETGLSLGQWRRQARFLHALRQLGAGLPVKRGALEAGYRNASAFIAAFRDTLHSTSGRYFETLENATGPGLASHPNFADGRAGQYPTAELGGKGG